jgi:hypothetical protein
LDAASIEAIIRSANHQRPLLVVGSMGGWNKLSEHFSGRLNAIL